MSLTKYTESLSRQLPMISNFYRPYYKQLLKSERSLLDFGAIKHMLFIGSGADPQSVLEMRRFTDAKIMLCDWDLDMINKAKEKLRLHSVKDVECVHQNGIFCPFKRFDVVYIAKQVRHKNEIIDKILRCAPKTKVLVRYGRNENLYNQQSPKKCHYHVRGFTAKTCLYHA